MSRPAVFLDRDGVLVEEIYYPETGETEAPLKPEHVRLIPGAAAVMRRLEESNFVLILISNQAGFAKGKTSLRALWLAHERFVSLLAMKELRSTMCIIRTATQMELYRTSAVPRLIANLRPIMF